MINYFLISHQENINLYEYQNIPNIKLTLVGQRHSNIDNTTSIVCNTLAHHIENYPTLCSYTAWYAIAQNGLSNAEFVSLLEYDILISKNFHQTNLDLINNSLDKTNFIIAYNKTLTNHYVFYKSTPWLEIALKNTYNIDLQDFIYSYKDKLPFWPTSTNITMPKTIFYDFISWFHPMTECFKNDSLGSYVHERAFFIFCAIHNIKIYYANNVLWHKQLQSHKSYDIYGTFLRSKQTHTLKDSMLKEYDEVYLQAMKICQLTHNQHKI
jgi:hypothetical protein